MKILIDNIPKEDRPFLKRLLKDFSRLHFVTSGKNNLYIVYEEPLKNSEENIQEIIQTKIALSNALFDLREFQANK